MKERKIFIIIPVHNNLDYTKSCIESLVEQDFNLYEIVLIDDGSTDGTYDFCMNNFPFVKIITGDGSLWWTASINLGLQYVFKNASNDDFILTLNNDLEVNKDYLSSLIQAYDENEPCLVGSISVFNDDPEKIDFLGKKWNPYLSKTRPTINIGSSYSQIIKNHNYIDTDLLTGRGTLIPVSVAKKVGLYDEFHFPQYIADYDYGLRAKKIGYKSIISTKALVKSVVSNTGLNYKLRKVSYVQFLSSFFSIKSPIQLRARYYWAVLHSPIGILSFILDFIRIIVSFHRQFFLSRIKK